MDVSREEWRSALISRHGEELYEKLSSASAAVCGLGGLGSHVAAALARAGVGRLILIDCDRVDITNLHRQQYTAAHIGMYKTEALSEILHGISPALDTELCTVRVTSENAYGLLRGADIVIEAFDTAQDKAMLADVIAERAPDKYYIGASGMAGIGSGNGIKTRKLGGRMYICGDGESDVADSALFSARVMLCAAHQALTALRIIAGEYGI